MAAERAFARIQDRGQVTLPAGLRRRLGLKTGDLVAVTETPDGILIAPQELVAARALAEIGEALAEQGLTLDEMIARGQAIRAELAQERYGFPTEAAVAPPDEPPNGSSNSASSTLTSSGSTDSPDVRTADPVAG